ncbi:TPA: RNHCP domain-containing protein [Candidatus Amesbacteria bacterium]|nr:RNHCP domain-containing protein [Candidatus Amesbacteria bacterium]
MSFECVNCHYLVREGKRYAGTENRNHCTKCLWSLHADLRPGDRKALCGGKMNPAGLTFKRVKKDKYGKEKVGELMLVHQCVKCLEVSINRIAADDDPVEIMNLVNSGFSVEGISVLDEADRSEVRRQLFGV